MNSVLVVNVALACAVMALSVLVLNQWLVIHGLRKKLSGQTDPVKDWGPGPHPEGGYRPRPNPNGPTQPPVGGSSVMRPKDPPPRKVRYL